jgi:Mrp family chromosome partitioning ATPase/capsular polysaccharide biosynthesis protein
MSLVSDALRNRLLSIIGITLVTVALAALLAWKWPDSYTSSVDVMLTPSVGNALGPDSSRSGDQINVAMQTEAGLISSSPVAKLVGKAVGSTVEPGDRAVVATVPANTQIIRIEYGADTADKAVKFADAYAQALLDSRDQRSTDSVASQLEALKKQEDAAAAGLKQASADAVSSKSPESTGMVQLYTNRLAAIQDKVGTLEATPTSPGSIISPASRPTSSDGIPAPLLILAGLVIGLVLGGIYAISRERGDDRIRAAMDGAVDDCPVMGVVPSGAGLGTETSTEAYRAVRTAVLASSAPPSTVVVSAVDESLIDEAQQVALSTASALAASGYRTCLVDASLTDGPIAEMQGANTGVGLAGALATGEVKGVELRTAAGFQIVDGGLTSEDTRERFGGAHMRSMLAGLAEEFDYVLVASPDLGTPEANELALSAGGVMLVAAEQHTKREEIRRVTLRAEQLGIDLLGIVAVTRSEQRRRRRRVAVALAAPSQSSDG